MRRIVCVSARVEPEQGGGKLALIEDISVTGARLLSRTESRVGERVRLDLYLSGTDQSPETVMARVVRLLSVDTRHGIWRSRVAVTFDSPLVGHDEEIELLAEREKRISCPPPAPSAPRSRT